MLKVMSKSGEMGIGEGGGGNSGLGDHSMLFVNVIIVGVKWRNEH